MFAQRLNEALTLSEIVFLKSTCFQAITSLKQIEQRCLSLLYHNDQSFIRISFSFTEQVWWTGCSETPYFCRGGIFNNNCYILVVTDLRSVWVTRADEEQVTLEKAKFNPSIEAKHLKDILGILDGPMRQGRVSRDFKKLEFRQNREEDLIFTMEFDLLIYPFKWEFFLTKMGDNEIFEILVADFISPMAATIASLEARGNFYREKSISLEKQLLARLSERERVTFPGSVLGAEDASQLQIFHSKKLSNNNNNSNTGNDASFPNLDFGPAAKYYLSHYHSDALGGNQGNGQSVIAQNQKKKPKNIQRAAFQYFDSFQEEQLNQRDKNQMILARDQDDYDDDGGDKQAIGTAFRQDSKKRIGNLNLEDQSNFATFGRVIEQASSFRSDNPISSELFKQPESKQNTKKSKKLQFL